jgi:hypothetical protein
MAFGKCAIHERLVNVIFELVSPLTFCCSFQPFLLMTLLTDFFIAFRVGKELSDQGLKIGF